VRVFDRRILKGAHPVADRLYPRHRSAAAGKSAQQPPQCHHLVGWRRWRRRYDRSRMSACSQRLSHAEGLDACGHRCAAHSSRQSASGPHLVVGDGYSAISSVERFTLGKGVGRR
jgi:hypothetical protein